MSKKDPKIITADEDKFYVQFYNDILTGFDNYCCKHGNSLERSLCNRQIHHFDKRNPRNIKDYYNFRSFIGRARNIKYSLTDKDGETFTFQGRDQMFYTDTPSFDSSISSVKDLELTDVSASQRRGPGKYYQKIKL